MATYHFKLRLKKNAKTKRVNKVGKVHLMYTHDSQTCQFSTGLTTEKNSWNKAKGQFIGKDANSLNEVLDKFKSKVNKIVIDLQRNEIYPSPKKVKEMFEASGKQAPEAAILVSMANLWKAYIQYLKETPSKITEEKRSERTIASNENSRQSFETFLIENGIQNISPENFKDSHLHKFEGYLLKKYASSNSRSKRKKHFKSFLKYSRKAGHPAGFDLDELTYKEKARPKVHISEDELKAITEAPAGTFTGRMLDCQAFTVLGCNTGLRISDLKRLHENVDGDKIKFHNSQKTGVPIELPLLPQVRAILERYNYQLPTIPEPKLRKGAKEVFKKLFPDKTVQVKQGNKMVTVEKWQFISPHSWVRSFVTISHRRGMAINDIAEIVKKSKDVLLKHYLAEDQEAAIKSMTEKWGESPLTVSRAANT